MSKVIITVDTVENTVRCNIDGQVFEGSKSVNIHSFRDEVFVDIQADNGEVGDNLRKLTRVVTASDREAKSRLKTGNATMSDDKTLIAYIVDDPDYKDEIEEGIYALLGRSKNSKEKDKKESIY